MDYQKKKKVRLGFVDFWQGFHQEEHFLIKSLSEKYEIEIDNESPDFLFYSCFGLEHLKFQNIVKIFYTGENVFPNFNVCDYSLSFVRNSMGGRNLYLPMALLFEEDLLKISDSDARENRRFCNFIYSQDIAGEGAILRKQFCTELMKYKAVDCPGTVLHNMEAPELSKRHAKNWQTSKINFLKKYKFTISFENSNTDGYMTEKLIQPLLAGSVPIYWGSEGNVLPFSKDCMICANDYSDMESLIQRIREVDENDALYLKMCEANPLRIGKIESSKTAYLQFFDKIFDKGSKPLKKDPLHFDTSNRLINNPYVSLAISLQRWINSHSMLKNLIKLLLNRK